MACWKVGTGHLIASLLLLLLELESGSESVDGECCGILVEEEEEEVLIAETAKRRRGRKRWWLRLAIRKRERPEAWGLRKEMTRGKARMAMAMALKGLEAWTEKLRLCLVTVFVFYFQKLVFGNIKKKQFSCIF